MIDTQLGWDSIMISKIKAAYVKAWNKGRHRKEPRIVRIAYLFIVFFSPLLFLASVALHGDFAIAIFFIVFLLVSHPFAIYCIFSDFFSPIDEDVL
jgi:hypothetical protein